MGMLKLGEIYKNSKGGSVQVICNAKYFRTGEKLVIYQMLYGDFSILAKNEEEFIEEFGAGEGTLKAGEGPKNPVCGKGSDSPINVQADLKQCDEGDDKANDKSNDKAESVIMQFLEAGCSEEKLEIIRSNRGKIDDRTLNNIEASMDIISNTDDPDARISYICDVLRMKSRFDSKRLRS